MAYWLLKSEPSSYGWDDLNRDGATWWDGIWWGGTCSGPTCRLRR